MWKPRSRSHEFKQWPDIMMVGCSQGRDISLPCFGGVDQVDQTPAEAWSPQLDQEQVCRKP
jgi:hypothetical protein